jgi:hypothetical protein
MILIGAHIQEKLVHGKGHMCIIAPTTCLTQGACDRSDSPAGATNCDHHANMETACARYVCIDFEAP